MLDFSFGELVLIALVALLVVGPRDLPVVMRAVGKWFGQFKSIADEFRAGFKSAMEDTLPDEVQRDFHAMHEDMQYIRDAEGNLQRTYDISDFVDESKSNVSVTVEKKKPL